MAMLTEKYKSDNEFFGEVRTTHSLLKRVGWKKGDTKIFDDLILIYYHKNGYSMHIVYGCTERVKKEIGDF